MTKGSKELNRAPTFCGEVTNRWREIVRHKNFLFAVMLTAGYIVASCIPGPFAPRERSTIAELSSGILAVSGFGFSVALAAIAIVVALPQSQLSKHLISNKAKGRSAFGELLFVLVWTAVVQVVAAAVAICALLIAGKSVVFTCKDLPSLFAGALVILTGGYGLLQLAVAVIAVWQVAVLQERFAISQLRSGKQG